MAWNRILAAAGALALAGCTSVDQFATRPTAYNIEAETAQNQQILLNVVRSSQRRPLEFTQLQSVSAATSEGLTIALSQPLKEHGGTTASTLAPTITASGGPTITVAVLDTQEFYQAILKPLTTQELDLYLKRGLPQRAVYHLFVSRIAVSFKQPGDKDFGEPETFSNDVADAEAFDRFQKMLDVLINDGLGTKPTKGADVEGPIMTPDEASQSDFLARSAAAGLQVSTLGWCDLDDTDLNDVLLKLYPGPGSASQIAATTKDVQAGCKTSKPKPGASTDALILPGLPSTFYQATKPSSSFARCLDDGVGDSRCSSTSPSPTAAHALKTTRMGRAGCDLLRRLKCGPDTEVSYALTMRSTAGMIYYLGEVFRMAAYPDRFATCDEQAPSTLRCPRVIAVRVHPADDTPAACEIRDGAPSQFSDPSCQPLFAATSGGGANGSRIQVRYGSALYAIPAGGPGDYALTYDALDIVSELIDLHRSGKDTPATNVLTLVGGH